MTDLDYWYLYTFVGLLTHHAILPSCYAQVITSPLPSEVKNLCPDEDIYITCETRGSPTLSWRSDEYIDTGGTSLTFAAFNNPGMNMTSPVNSNTFAILIKSTEEDGVNVLESRLHIVTSTNFSIATITCTSANNSDSLRLQILGDPDEPRDVVAFKERKSNGLCEIYLLWKPPINIATVNVTQYMVYINGSNEANETTKFMFATYSVCSCNYQQTVSIGTVDTCGRAGQRTSDITAAIGKPSLTTELEMDCTPSTGSDCSGVEDLMEKWRSIAIAFIVIAFVIISSLTVTVIVVLIKTRRALKSAEEKIQEMREDINKLTNDVP